MTWWGGNHINEKKANHPLRRGEKLAEGSYARGRGYGRVDVKRNLVWSGLDKPGKEGKRTVFHHVDSAANKESAPRSCQGKRRSPEASTGPEKRSDDKD